MTENSLPACDCFTILETRTNFVPSVCDVCERAQDDHQTTERRRLSGTQIEELRKRLIIQRYEQMQERREQHEANGTP